MKNSLSIILLFAGIFLADVSYSQWQPSWNAGAAIGTVKGANEALSQSFDLQFNLYGLWLNGLAPHLSLEAAIGTAKNSSPNLGGYSEYSTSLIPIDLCVRYAPFAGADWQPYVYAGIGLLSYSVHSPLPSNVAADAKLSGITGFFPIGVGIYRPFDNHFAVDCSVGENPTLTDNLNPVHDSRNDPFWGFKIGITYCFGRNSVSQEDDFDFGVRGTVRILSDVSFDTASSRIKKESETQLLQILAALESHPEVEIEFRAYTDDSGDFNTNMALTHDRAESAKIWLVTHGIPVTRISTQGYGPHNPLVMNDTPEHRKQNCRLEMVRMK